MSHLPERVPQPIIDFVHNFRASIEKTHRSRPLDPDDPTLIKNQPTFSYVIPQLDRRKRELPIKEQEEVMILGQISRLTTPFFNPNLKRRDLLGIKPLWEKVIGYPNATEQTDINQVLNKPLTLGVTVGKEPLRTVLLDGDIEVTRKSKL